MFTRRQAIKRLIMAGTGALFTGFYTWRVEPHWLEFTFPTLPINNLPPQLEGKTLAQLTDPHVGREVDDDYIIRSFRRLQEQAPDFIVCTGDWITYHDLRQLQQLRRVLAHMPHGRLGTIGILGNHDYGRRWSELDVAEEVTSIAREAEVTMLRNQSVTCAGLQFIGLDDFWSPCFDPVPVLAETNQQTPAVVLCHNPDAADQPVWGKYQGWILAGHTHGGQCKPPFLPPPELPVKNRRYTAGEIQLSGNRRLYISRGVGHLLRVRFNARPEIPVFRLQSAAAMSPIPGTGKS